MSDLDVTRLSDDEALALVTTMMNEGRAIPLELEERSLRIHLVSYPDRSDLLQRLCAVLAAQGRPVPLELEERSLVALIPLHPDREDLKARLRIVRVALGKGVPPPAIVGVGGEMASQTDVDFQVEADAAEARSSRSDMDARFAPIMERCRRFTMTSVERMYALYKAVEYVVAADIPGAIVECGVWRGGSVMVALSTLAALGRVDRDVYLFDTFEGLPRPDTEVDVDMFGNRAIDGWTPHSRGGERSNWAYAGLEDVRANVASTGYPQERVRFIKGMVEDTVPAEAPDRIALLRLDTDWYSSTKHEMEHLYPRLSKGGVLIIDDYGHFLGARRAVDEYIAERRIPILLQRVDYTGRSAIKP